MKMRMEQLSEKKMIGMCLQMTLADNKTRELWQQFMPRLKEIEHRTSSDKFSIQFYPDEMDVTRVDPNRVFEKRAAVEVSRFDIVPEGMDAFLLPGGLYAVFLHQGPPTSFPQTAQYIFGTWLPNAPYESDNRPHFEVLGEKYSNTSPDSEEEIWIPVRLKAQE